MMLLPPAPGTCPICAIVHDSDAPHDRQSLYYQMRFKGLRGRWPTWADAAAHCTPEVQAAWKEALESRGREWSEPDDGEPIADPPAESFHQPVGNPNTRGFGPEEED